MFFPNSGDENQANGDCERLRSSKSVVYCPIKAKKATIRNAAFEFAENNFEGDPIAPNTENEEKLFAQQGIQEKIDAMNDLYLNIDDSDLDDFEALYYSDEDEADVYVASNVKMPIPMTSKIDPDLMEVGDPMNESSTQEIEPIQSKCVSACNVEIPTPPTSKPDPGVMEPVGAAPISLGEVQDESSDLNNASIQERVPEPEQFESVKANGNTDRNDAIDAQINYMMNILHLHIPEQYLENCRFVS